MSNPFYDNEFEDFLKQHADQMRMYPGDNVWRNIHHEIHGHTRWPALTLFSILIIASLVIGTLVFKPHKAVLAESTTAVAEKIQSENANEAAGANKESGASAKKAAGITPLQKEDAEKDMLAAIVPQQIIPADLNAEKIIAADNSISGLNNTIVAASQPYAEISNAVAETKAVHTVADAEADAIALDNNVAKTSLEALITEYPYANFSSFFYNAETEDVTDANFFSVARIKNNNPNRYQGGFRLTALPDRSDISQLNLQYAKKLSSPAKIKLGKGFKSHLDFQFYVTPSFSFRRLVDNEHGLLSKSYISALPFASNYVVDIDQLIQHTPAMGYEVGTSVGYNITDNFAVRTGFQFNMQQYNISAYAQSLQPANIPLFTSNNSIATLDVVSGFRSTPTGTQQLSLKNRYYEISMPVGVDWRPVNNGKVSIGFAAAIQPTYKFDKEPFIISSNYKNYADGSQLMRNWTLNSNFETYVAYQAGAYRLQLGPQIRYQLMPTMSTNYPIKEYLLDYGVKIGLVKSLK